MDIYKLKIIFMQRSFILSTLFVFFLGLNGIAQDTIPMPKKAWETGGNIGLDFSQLLMFNPPIGGGENKMGIGGLTSLFAKYAKNKTVWTSDGNLHVAVQRIGSKEKPFTKNLDLLRLNTKYGRLLSPKLNASFVGTFESLLLNTYSDLTLSSSQTNTLKAKFLSPATLLLAPGFDYKHSDQLSVFLTPAAYKTIIVLDDEIAKLGVHGNPFVSSTDYKNFKHEFGGHLKAMYKNTFVKKLAYAGELNLFYDYLAKNHGVEYIDVVWLNNFGLEIVKGLTLNLIVDARWDRDIASVLSEGTPDGLTEFRKWMITQAFTIKYNYVFK
jgi:hypothetical protein